MATPAKKQPNSSEAFSISANWRGKKMEGRDGRRDDKRSSKLMFVSHFLTSSRERQTVMEPRRRFSDLLNDVLSSLHVFLNRTKIHNICKSYIPVKFFQQFGGNSTSHYDE